MPSSDEFDEETSTTEARAKLKAFVESKTAKSTVKATKRAVVQLQNFMADKKSDFREVHELRPTKLDTYIGEYVLQAKKPNGEQYEPNSLSVWHRGLARYLESKDYPADISKDKEFSSSRKVIAAKRKDLKQMGLGNLPNRSEQITEEDEVSKKKCVHFVAYCYIACDDVAILW